MAITDVEIRDLQNQLAKGQFSAVSTQVNSYLAAQPEHIELLYLKAVAARYQKQYEIAKTTLEKLRDIKPDFGRALQEDGHLCRDMGAPQQALQFYKLATRANPALRASWINQAKILDKAGEKTAANQARQNAKHVGALPKKLQAALNFIHEGKVLKAEKICRHFLQKNPHNIEAMRLLAEIAARLNIYSDADFLLESAIEFEPDNIQLRLDHIKILRKRQKFARALEQAEHLYKLDEKNPIFQSQLAVEHMQTGNHETALELFDKVLKTVPRDPMTLTSKGHALKTFGHHEQAVESYQAAYRAQPAHGDAYYGLANLKTYRFTDDEITQMDAQSARGDIGFMDRVHLCFSLGKAFEDRKEFKRAFDFYQKGNDLKRLQTRYKPSDMSRELEAQIASCTSELFQKKEGLGCLAPDPIFIVGLPRAGSTLIEQILASHSQIDGTLELPNILSLAYKLRGRDPISVDGKYPKILHDLTAQQLREMGELYIEETRIHRKSAAFFIDKMPNNFRHIGLISLILPHAKIIDARRHPMACCFSGFKQLFAEGQEFTYSQSDIGHYYRDYTALMRHWDQVLPERILRVQYEDVVADIDTQVRRILTYLGLPFEASCVEFHKTKRSVRTASSEQVRQPIYTSGLEQWRHFDPWLNPLKTALGPTLETYHV